MAAIEEKAGLSGESGGQAFSSYRYVPVVLLAAVGCALSVYGFTVAGNWGRSQMEGHFILEAKERVSALRRSLESSLQEVEGLGAFFGASGVPERREFSRFVRPFLDHEPGIQALEWIPRVADAQRAEYEAAARAEGFPGFQITERTTQGRMVRARQRTEYFPVYFVEPYRGNEMALGFDLASHPPRLEALTTSRDTGAMLATARITLVQETAEQFGFLVYLPIYQNGAATDSVEKRRESLVGFVLCVFRVGDILEKAMAYLEPEGIDVHVFDDSSPGDPQLLGFHPSRARQTAGEPVVAKSAVLRAALSHFQTFDVAGRKWTVICTPTSEFLATGRSWTPWAVLGAGVLLTGIVVAYISLTLALAEQTRRSAEEILQSQQHLQQEIAERKRVEELLLESKRQMEFILGATKTGLDIIDSQYNLRYVDPEWMKAYGDWTGRKCHEYFMGRSEPCPSCGIPDALRTKQISVTEEVLVKEGNRPIQVITRPYQDKNGEWLVAEANADITERKRAEEARRDSEKRYRTLFEGAVEGILVADLETRQFKHANPAVCRMLGYSEKELLRLGVADIHPKESLEQVVAEFEAQARGEKILALALQCLRKDGTVFYADVSTAPGVIDGRPCNVGFFADITERKRAEQELEESAEALAKVNAELERSNCDLEEFTHTVSHDLQEPLRKIHTFGQFLVEDLGEQLPESAREHVRRMQEAAVRMQGLIQHLLGLARVGTAGREPVAVAAGMVVDKVLETLSERVRESGADITVAAELPRVMADPVQLEQVFQNLLSNALKFRSPERQPRITIGASREGEQVRFAVSDNGIGIEERFFERIFGMFQRLHPGEQYEGAGVGLALCAKIVRRHGGRIWVESEVGKGSTFFFTLPAPPSAKEGACEH